MLRLNDNTLNAMQEYNKTDRLLHTLCQVIAKVNRTFVPKKDDDSHTNLYFDTLGNRISGRWIKTEKEPLLFTLNLGTLNFELLSLAQKKIFSASVTGKTIEEIEVETEKLLLGAGLYPEGLRNPLHFEIPKYFPAKTPVASIPLSALEKWKYFRKLANDSCNDLMGHAQASSEIRIWPHHFDTGIYFENHSCIGIGFGLAMQDDMAGSPYFYMAGYPEKGSLSPEGLPQSNLWSWKTNEYWRGVILPLTNLENATEAQSKATLNDYLRQNYGWFIHQC